MDAKVPKAKVYPREIVQAFKELEVQVSRVSRHGSKGLIVVPSPIGEVDDEDKGIVPTLDPSTVFTASQTIGDPSANIGRAQRIDCDHEA